MTATNAPQQLTTATLIADKSGDIFSMRHRVLVAMRSELGDVPACSAEIQRLIEAGDLTICNDASAATTASCVHCGCDDEFGCDGGCSWAFPGVCSTCYEQLRKPRGRAEIEREHILLHTKANDLYDTALESKQPETMSAALGSVSAALMSLQTELLLDIRAASYEHIRITQQLAVAMGVMVEEMSENLEKAMRMSRLVP